MRIKVKETYCPLCFGEIVIDGKVTCIDGHDLSEVEFEDMDKIQTVIDYQATLVGDSHGHD